MGTRATYSFVKRSESVCLSRSDVHYYIHWDGYPIGAAEYFDAMMKLLGTRSTNRELRGGAAEQFLRANPLASFTSSPDSHGDTEYHYEVTEAGYDPMKKEQPITLKAWKLELGEERARRCIFDGPLADFLMEYRCEDEAQEESTSTSTSTK